MKTIHVCTVLFGLATVGCSGGHSKEMLERRLGTSIADLKTICAGGVSPKGDPDDCEPSVGVRRWQAARNEFPFMADVQAAKTRIEHPSASSPDSPSTSTPVAADDGFAHSLADQIANAYLLKAFTTSGGVSFSCGGADASLHESLTQQFGHNVVSVNTIAKESFTRAFELAIKTSSRELNVAIDGDAAAKLALELNRRLESASGVRGKVFWATLTFSGAVPPTSNAKMYRPCYEEARAPNSSLITGVSGFAILEYDANSEWLSEKELSAALEASGVSNPTILQSAAKLAASIRKKTSESGQVKVFSNSTLFIPTWFTFERPPS